MEDDALPIPTDIAKAQAAMERRAAIISGNRFQPKLVWTLTPWRTDELRALIDVGGASPFLVINGPVQLDRQSILWAGAPHWAQYCYLVMVEIKAVNVGR